MSFLKPVHVALLSALACLLQPQLAHAQNQDAAEHAGDDQDGSKWGVGIGASLKKSPYKGISNDNSYLPLISYENKYVKLFGNVFDVKLPSLGPVDFTLRTKVALGEGYKTSKSPYLAGMESRKGSIYVGATSTWKTDFAELSLDYLADVSGHSKGSQLKFGVEHAFNFERTFQITPHASLTRLDSKYVDYYYGVKPSEATLTRPEYKGKSTNETEVGVRFGYLVTPSQKILLDVSDSHWGSGISNSPLVAKKSTPGILLGYIYSF